jgi:hypothetical protein
VKDTRGGVGLGCGGMRIMAQLLTARGVYVWRHELVPIHFIEEGATVHCSIGLSRSQYKLDSMCELFHVIMDEMYASVYFVHFVPIYETGKGQVVNEQLEKEFKYFFRDVTLLNLGMRNRR